MAYEENAVFDAPVSRFSSVTFGHEGAAFRLAMRELASGVAVVTTGRGEQRSGCTATSLCSLSLDPPSLIVCIALDSSTLAALRASKTFGVNVLAGLHEDLADRFAGRGGVKGAARFAKAEWMTLLTGAPLLRGALACIDCIVEEVLERHTHAIVIGRVASVGCGGGAPALMHWRGQFKRVDES
jgi:flavin reductase (DIM6/NTAB) family NADH-FMN oxidoreductase RutF